MSHRAVQSTVTIGSVLQAGATLSTTQWTLLTLLTVLVGLASTLIWVWSE